jgi:hypothetical protein
MAGVDYTKVDPIVKTMKRSKGPFGVDRLQAHLLHQALYTLVIDLVALAVQAVIRGQP